MPEAKGGGYEVSISQLGRYAVFGVGETLEETLAVLTETKREYIEE